MAESKNGGGVGNGAAPSWQTKASALTEQWQNRTRKRILETLETTEPVEVALPSGLTVMAVRVNILSLQEAGKIPDGLTPYVTELLRIKQTSDAATLGKHVTNTMDRMSDLLDSVWLATVVAPTFTSDLVSEDDSIPMYTVEWNDKCALLAWAQGDQDHLATFRESADALRTPPDGEGVRPASSAYVRRRSDAKRPSAAGAPADAGDVLRGDIDRKPAQGNKARPGPAPRKGARRADVEHRASVDLLASSRPRGSAGGGKRRVE